MDALLHKTISSLQGFEKFTYMPLSGGDIAQIWKVSSGSNEAVIKYMKGSLGRAILTCEIENIQKIEHTQTIRVPEIYQFLEDDSGSCIVMEYIPQTKTPSPSSFNQLGRLLRQMHESTSQNLYGGGTKNFIGKLEQHNPNEEEWHQFYAKHRLIYQMRIASQNNLLPGFDTTMEESVLNSCASILRKNPKPSVLHGDLWNGNVLISANQTPYLIDPATYIGDGLIDIAMAQLFGGFPEEFYDGYGLENTTENLQKIELYQLYYLLVHLNLFGASYLPSVLAIMKKYF